MKSDRAFILSSVIRAFKRSRVRRDVFKLLLEVYPRGSYPSEIAKKIDATSSNVIGALRGTYGKERYKPSLSLVSLGLVEIVTYKGQKFYRLTKRGLEVAKSLKLCFLICRCIRTCQSIYKYYFIKSYI
jgi:predicted transcriptional regulator with HTH domain